MIPVNVEDGSSDQFGSYSAIHTASNGMKQFNQFLTTANFNTQAEATKVTSLRLHWENWMSSTKTFKTERGPRVSTRTKLSFTNKVKPPLETPLVDDRVSMEEALTRIGGFHQRGADTHKLRTGGRQSQSYLRSGKNSNNSPPDEKKELTKKQDINWWELRIKYPCFIRKIKITT